MSSYFSTTHRPFASTDAGFRTWAQKIHDALTAIGLTQTADTGQINLSTVTRPGSNDTAGGYEIWRFNDTLQATYPIFIKIEYGMNTVASNQPSLWITVGTGSNGSGTISGNPIARRQFAISAATNSDGESGFTYVDGVFAFALHGQIDVNTGRGGHFLLERFRDRDGNASGRGLAMAFIVSDPGIAWFTMNPWLSPARSRTDATWMYNSQTDGDGYDYMENALSPPLGIAMLQPLIPVMFGVEQPLLGFAGDMNGTLVNLSGDITRYGSPRRYWSSSLVPPTSWSRGSKTVTPLMLWVPGAGGDGDPPPDSHSFEYRIGSPWEPGPTAGSSPPTTGQLWPRTS
jgi:hypothetical protein